MPLRIASLDFSVRNTKKGPRREHAKPSGSTRPRNTNGGTKWSGVPMWTRFCSTYHPRPSGGQAFFAPYLQHTTRNPQRVVPYASRIATCWTARSNGSPQTNIVRLITSSSLHCQVTASAKYICRLRCMNRRRVALSAPYGHLRSMVFRLSAYGCRYHDCDLPTRVLPCMGRWWRGKDLHLLLRKQVDVLVHR